MEPPNDYAMEESSEEVPSAHTEESWYPDESWNQEEPPSDVPMEPPSDVPMEPGPDQVQPSPTSPAEDDWPHDPGSPEPQQPQPDEPEDHGHTIWEDTPCTSPQEDPWSINVPPPQDDPPSSSSLDVWNLLHPEDLVPEDEVAPMHWTQQFHMAWEDVRGSIQEEEAHENPPVDDQLAQDMLLADQEIIQNIMEEEQQWYHEANMAKEEKTPSNPASPTEAPTEPPSQGQEDVTSPKGPGAAAPVTPPYPPPGVAVPKTPPSGVPAPKTPPSGVAAPKTPPWRSQAMPPAPSPMAAAPTEAASSSSATPQVAQDLPQDQEWQFQPKVKATGWKNKLAWLISAYQGQQGQEVTKLCQLYLQDGQKSQNLSPWGHKTMTFCQLWESQQWVALELHVQKYLGAISAMFSISPTNPLAYGHQQTIYVPSWLSILALPQVPG